MGTNYYWITNECACCKRYDEYHIGKRSAGWVFSFQTVTLLSGGKPRSFADWKIVLQSGGIIKDEYGTIVSYDDFITIVEGTKGNKNTHAVYEGHWSDTEGYSFTESDFT